MLNISDIFRPWRTDSSGERTVASGTVHINAGDGTNLGPYTVASDEALGLYQYCANIVHEKTYAGNSSPDIEWAFFDDDGGTMLQVFNHSPGAIDFRYVVVAKKL